MISAENFLLTWGAGLFAGAGVLLCLAWYADVRAQADHYRKLKTKADVKKAGQMEGRKDP